MHNIYPPTGLLLLRGLPLHHVGHEGFVIGKVHHGELSFFCREHSGNTLAFLLLLALTLRYL